MTRQSIDQSKEKGSLVPKALRIFCHVTVRLPKTEIRFQNEVAYIFPKSKMILLFCKIALLTTSALGKYRKLSNVEKTFSPYEAESQLKTLLSIFVWVVEEVNICGQFLVEKYQQWHKIYSHWSPIPAHSSKRIVRRKHLYYHSPSYISMYLPLWRREEAKSSPTMCISFFSPDTMYCWNTFVLVVSYFIDTIRLHDTVPLVP